MASHPNHQVALEFIQEAGTMTTYLETIDITYQQVMDRIRQANGASGDAAAALFRDLLKRELQAEISSLESILADVYAAQFTPEELEELKQFFVKPVGQKLIGATTTIAQDFANQSSEFQQKMATVIMPKIQMEFKMNGYEI
ncbi:MAG: DUF2059 domain-containing protein [Pseudomonadota bacterium]